MNTNKKNKTQGLRVGAWNKGLSWKTELRKQINEIEINIEKYNLHILGISEANLSKGADDAKVQIENYNFIADKGIDSNRENARVVVYIRQDVDYKLRKDLMKNTVPEVWIDVGRGPSKKTIGFIYREHTVWEEIGKNGNSSSLQEQKRRFSLWLNEKRLLWSKRTETLILGDFNIDWNRKADIAYTKIDMIEDIEESLEQSNFSQLITGDTWARGDQKSRIDLCFTNKPQNISTVNNKICGSSDHNIIFIELKDNQELENKKYSGRRA